MISIGTRNLTVDDFFQVLYQGADIHLDERAVGKVQEGYDFIKEYSRDKIIYGINTGFGPMAQFKIDETDQHQLQHNLIRSHSSGSGQPMAEDLSRATMLARLNTLMLGFSGVHPETVHLLRDVLNQKVTACIYERGGVGASGDLVQLAHLALNLLGEGQVWHNGAWHEASKIFSDKKIAPLTIHLREGLALMNGTSAMTGVGMVNLIHARRLLKVSVLLSAITNEIMESFDDHFSKELNETKHHNGQVRIAEAVRGILTGSKLTRKRPEHLYNKKTEEAYFSDKVQEYYSLRCVPQILGPVMDVMDHVQQVLENEVNSVNDNPVIDPVSGDVYHGGNFHGDYVSLAMDQLKIVMTKLTMLSERQLNFLLNDKLNHKLPPFLNPGRLGLNFGLQGMQFTATSTTAENQTLSFPMYVHSIPNNNDNQDIVSMGCNSALIARKVIDNAFDVLSIQAVAVTQAIDILRCRANLAPASGKFYDEMKNIMPDRVLDEPPYPLIRAVREHISGPGITINF